MGEDAIEKRWDPKREVELIALWESEGLYRSTTYGGDKGLVVIDTPPPYTSGKWHVGGAAHYAQIDMVARYMRMKGYRVIAPWYADRNGLPVEILVERQTGINPHEVAKTPEGREKFLSLCKEKLDEVEKDLVRIWKRLGCSFEYWENGTDSQEYRRLTQATFIEMWKRGLIYEAERPVYWCPRCMTTLAEAEIEYAEKPAELYYIRIELNNGKSVTIATTRPELLGAMMALAYNPNDPRYQGLEGARGRVPIYGYEVPVITHPEVDPSFGTGIEMVCSYGDTRDLRILRELGLIDKARIVIDKSGRMNELSGELKGLTIAEARKKMVEILRSIGVLEKVEKLGPRRAPTCWRCGTPVEIIHSRELFLKQLEFADKLIDISSKMEFKPEFHRQKLIDWIKSLRIDWPVSKTRYYATEIPLWRCTSCGSYLVPEPGRYYRPWRDPPPFEKCPVCGAGKEKLEGDKRVFDTWFDSSISPLYVSGYMRDEKLFSQAVGNILRPQGYEIIRTWLYYTILRVYLLLNIPAFKWVRISGMGLDEKGEAMHKSKGNVIDPEPLLEKYGADAFRFWAAGAAKLGYDYRFSENMIRTGSLFVTKLINISRFISRFPDPSEGYVLRAIDKALLAKLSETIERVDKAYSEFDVYEPIHAIYDFAWNIFADHYIEAVKTRAYNNEKTYSEEEQRGAWYTLHRALEAILRILAPIMPFSTDYIWRTLKGRSIHLERFPEEHREWRNWSQEPLNLMIKVNSAVWKYKKERNMRFSEKLNATLYIDNQNARSIEREIKDLHRIPEIAIGKPGENAEEIAEGIWILRKSTEV
ncbi:valine--tRNA ligase [Desulfurococcaceae archaeon AG1]|jgi:valyl-tRNA synthetase|nr:valine--tRNA ligase [Desulfurococcaceae archaeon AG1]